MTKNQEVLILCAYIRFGREGNYVDNISSVGISVGIHVDSGCFMDYAYDGYGFVCKTFPNTSTSFSSLSIPYWDEVIDLAESVQKSFPFYKLMCLDIGIAPQAPILVEIHPSHDNISLEQKTGLLFSNANVKKALPEYRLI